MYTNIILVRSYFYESLILFQSHRRQFVGTVSLRKGKSVTVVGKKTAKRNAVSQCGGCHGVV